MACEACGHSMQLLAAKWFWCPRCGSIYDGLFPQHTPPKLVERCRNFEAWARSLGAADIINNQWQATGIAESITPPSGEGKGNG
jgi:anaerobic ribonucleoside-triphosphate reductase